MDILSKLPDGTIAFTQGFKELGRGRTLVSFRSLHGKLLLAIGMLESSADFKITEIENRKSDDPVFYEAVQSHCQDTHTLFQFTYSEKPEYVQLMGVNLEEECAPST